MSPTQQGRKTSAEGYLKLFCFEEHSTEKEG